MGDVERLDADDFTLRLGAVLNRSLYTVLDDVWGLVDRSPAPFGERLQVGHVGDRVVPGNGFAGLPANVDWLEENLGRGLEVGEAGVEFLRAREIVSKALLDDGAFKVVHVLRGEVGKDVAAQASVLDLDEEAELRSVP